MLVQWHPHEVLSNMYEIAIQNSDDTRELRTEIANYINQRVEILLHYVAAHSAIYLVFH